MRTRNKIANLTYDYFRTTNYLPVIFPVLIGSFLLFNACSHIQKDPRSIKCTSVSKREISIPQNGNQEHNDAFRSSYILDSAQGHQSKDTGIEMIHNHNAKDQVVIDSIKGYKNKLKKNGNGKN
jgi:hypothetical protein